MAKTTTAGMDTHLKSEVTTLAMATVIERTDKVKFRLTTSSEDVKIDIGDGDGEQTYLASEGVSRTNITNDAELNVDNLDIIGVFDNIILKDTELRRGLFDFAEFKIFVFNHQDKTDGIVKIFRGQFGEVTVSKLGFFKVQVRSLIQVFSKQTGEHYSKDCRDDLGGLRCAMPISLNEIVENTAYALGDYVLIKTIAENNECAQIVMNFEGADGATSGVGFDNIGEDGTQPNTIAGTAQIDTAEMPSGGSSTSSLLLDGNSDYLTYTDRAAWTLGAGQVTISMHFRLNALGAFQSLASKHNQTGDQREWLLRVRDTNVLDLLIWGDGLNVDINIVGTTVLSAGVDYHVAAVRKQNGDWVVFLDGNIEIGPTTPTLDPFNGTAEIAIGAVFVSGAYTQFVNGWIDSFEFLVGFARWETTFTPPTGNAPTPVLTPNPNPIHKDFGDRVYEVTVAGTTSSCILAPNETISGTHIQGSVTLIANHSWMRAAEVFAVELNDERRIFTVSELIPNSGEAVGVNRFPSSLGFPDDWFNGGAVFFQSGANAGITLEVRDFISNFETQPLVMNFEGADGATSGVGFDNIGFDGTQPSIFGTAQIDTAEIPAGGSSTSSLLLDGNSDYLAYTDRAAWALGTGPLTISTHFRLNGLGVLQVPVSKHDNGDQEWYIQVRADNTLLFVVFKTATVFDLTLSGTTVLTTGVDYHVAVVRKNNGDWVMFLDGVIEAGPTTPTNDPFNGTADLRIGALKTSFVTQFFNGWIDSFDLNIGIAKWETAFTPPTGNIIVPDQQKIELISDMPFDIAVGDDLRLFPGCDKTNAVCISKFKNGINFVGEPFVPGEDVLGQYPDAH